MEDNAIIELYFARSEQAIRETEEKYGAYLSTIADNILHRREDAEEAVNDTYLAAWNTIPPTRPRVLRHFLSRIVRNQAFTRYSYLTAARGRTTCRVKTPSLGVKLHRPPCCWVILRMLRQPKPWPGRSVVGTSSMAICPK